MRHFTIPNYLINLKLFFKYFIFCNNLADQLFHGGIVETEKKKEKKIEPNSKLIPVFPHNPVVIN